MGYHRAGFDVVGVDIKPQPRYCGDEFYQSDALGFLHSGFDMVQFDAVHASPPCQRFSQMSKCRPGLADEYPDLVAPVRELLKATGLPWVIENVVGAPLETPVQICGTGLGMKVQRHRWFESNIALWGVPCQHRENSWDPRYGHATGRKRRRVPVIGEWRVKKHLQDEAMGIDWMTLPELSEAIPPAYTEFVGAQLLAVIGATA